MTLEEARWRAAIENATLGVWDLSPQSDIVRYSPEWKARLGFPITGTPDSTSFWRSRVHPDDFNPMLRALRLHLDGYTATYEMRFRLRSGNFRYVTVKSRGRVVERNARGESIRMVGTMVDPTGRMSVAAVGAALADGAGPAHEFPAPDKMANGTAREAPGPRLPLLDELDRRALYQVSDLLDIAVSEGTASAGAAFAPAARHGRSA